MEVEPGEVDLYGDQFFNNLVGSGCSTSATGCLSVGSGDAESFTFDNGGNFGLRLWHQSRLRWRHPCCAWIRGL